MSEHLENQPRTIKGPNFVTIVPEEDVSWQMPGNQQAKHWLHIHKSFFKVAFVINMFVHAVAHQILFLSHISLNITALANHTHYTSGPFY